LKFVGAVCLGGALFTAGVGVLTAQHWRGTVALAGAADVPNQADLSNNELADTGLFQQTLDAVAAIEDPVERLKLLLRIAQEQLNAGDRQGALATADKSLALARELESDSEKVRALCSIARLQNDAGQKQASRATARDAEKLSLALSKSAEIEIGLGDVAVLLSSWAEYDDCLRLADQSGNRRDQVLIAMARMVRPTKGTEAGARQALQRAADMAVRPMKVDPKEARVFFMPRNRAQESIAVAQARIGDLDRALKTVDAIHYGDPRIGDGELAGSWGGGVNDPLEQIARELVQAGDFQGALKTAADARIRNKFKAEILRLIAEKQASNSDFEGAIKTAAQLSNLQEKANVIRDIAIVQIEKGDRNGGQARLEELRRLNESLQDTEKNSESFSSPLEFATRTAQADIEARLGDFKEALKTAGNQTSARDKAQSLLAIGAQMLVAGKKEEARQVLRRASRSAERIPEQASKIMRSPEGRSRKVGFPQVEKEMLLLEIAQQQARAGDAEGAFETAESLPPSSNLDWLLIAMAAGGDMDGAVESLAKLTKTEAKERALEGIARIMTKAGKEQEATALAAKQKSLLLKAYTLLGMALGKAKGREPGGE
jgi:tetratricopeptide (TPR) repeat protein